MIVNPSAKPRGKPPDIFSLCDHPQGIEKGRGKPPFTRYVSNIPDVIGRARGDPKGIPRAGVRSRGDPAPYEVMVGRRGDPGG